MIVVSNTSPLTNLAAIGRFELLNKLYTEIYIADGVWDELNAGGKAWPGSREVEAAEWIIQHPVQPSSKLTELYGELDRGEAESIILAKDLAADIILLDENEGRQMAKRLGLKPLGVLGLLLDAKAKNLIEAVQSELDALRQQAGFYITDNLYQQVLQQAGEI